MKNSTLFLIGIFCVGVLKISAQNEFLLENENDIYWQPGVEINFSDFQSSTNEDCLKYNEMYGFTMSSSIGIRGVVDVPRKKRKYEKFYVAPVFCKNCSCILTEDSLSLKVDRLVLDIAEVFARRIRRELAKLQEEVKADNTYSMFFNTYKARSDEYLRDASGTVLREVLLERNDSAYLSWRQTIDEILRNTEKDATTPEDCHRFAVGKPIAKGYKEAKYMMGDLGKRKEE